MARVLKMMVLLSNILCESNYQEDLLIFDIMTLILIYIYLSIINILEVLFLSIYLFTLIFVVLLMKLITNSKATLSFYVSVIRYIIVLLYSTSFRIHYLRKKKTVFCFGSLKPAPHHTIFFFS